MNNLLYHTDGKCACGGHSYVSAVYVEQSNTGEWHIMIEETCHNCHRLDLTDIPWSDITGDPRMVEAARAAYNQDQESERAEAEESGIPAYDDDLGLPSGFRPPSDPADL